MATQAQIFDLRLQINDPSGFIAFTSVANAAALPAIPASQTCYLQTDTSEYKSTEKTSGATATDYTVEELYISDTVLGNLIDLYGADGAACQAIKRIIARIGKELGIRRNQAGADSTEYQTLSDTLSYYKELLAMCTDQKKSDAGTNTGRVYSSADIEIAGGNL